MKQGEKKCSKCGVITTTIKGLCITHYESQRLRLKKSLGNIKDYGTNDHYHCPSKDSPCGFKGKHRCCLCGKLKDNK